MAKLRIFLILLLLIFLPAGGTARADFWEPAGLSGSNLWALFGTGGRLFAGTTSGFSYTDDGGASWTAGTAANSGLLFNAEVRAFAVSGGNLFAGTNGEGVFFSNDNGGNWTQVNTGLTGYSSGTAVWALAVSGTNLFAGTNGSGVFLFTTGGWVQVNTGLTQTGIRSLAVSGGNLFAGTSGGVFLSTNNGASWAQVSNGLPPGGASDVRALAMDGGNLYAGTMGGVFLSSDNGASWSPASVGLPAFGVAALSVSGTNLFAGTFGGGVFHSTNSGASWIAENTGLTSNDIHAFAFNGTRLFTAAYGGVFRTGKDWIPPPAQYTVTTGSNPGSGGTTSGGGTYGPGSTVTVTATPHMMNGAANYSFVNWTENGTEVSTSSSYTFTLIGNRALVAHFTSLTISVPAWIIWDLLSSESKTSAVGDISGHPESVQGMSLYPATPYGNNGQQLWVGDTGWTAGPLEPARYLQFDAGPAPGNTFTVDTVSFNYGDTPDTRTDYNILNCQVFYSTDQWLTPGTALSSTALPYLNTTMSTFKATGLKVPVAEGQTFSLRIYPYALQSTTPAAPAFAIHNHIVISGTTRVSGSLNNLHVSKTGHGSGVVVSDPDGINCGSACSAVFESGVPVTLIAKPEPGSVFAGWQGGGCSGRGACIDALDGVTATFSVLGDVDGNGAIEIKDAIVTSQVVSGIPSTSSIDLFADVDGNQKLDLSESLFDLQVIARLRENDQRQRAGSITIVKDAQPDDNQAFAFTSATATIAPFLLDDDGNNSNALSNQKGFFLAPGTYTFTEGPVNGWNLAGISCTPSAGTRTNITTGSATIILASEDNITCTFTNRKEPTGSGKICGVKFNDLNGDGQQNPGEPGIPNWLISLGITSVPTVTTEAEGNYCFNNLPAGIYTVSEAPQAPWQQTFPSSPGAQTVTLTEGQQMEGINFGNKLPSRSCSTSLCNGDFEDNQLVSIGGQGFFDQSLISCWNTTEADGLMEVWGSGFGTVPAYSGNQFIEMNAHMGATVYQTITVQPGSTVAIFFAHRGRVGFPNQMSVSIEPASGGAPSPLGTFVASTSVWTTHNLTYTFPNNGVTSYVLRFTADDTGAGGNFLDAVSVECQTATVGSITIVKDAVPDDPQPFFFLFGNSGGSFALDDGGNNATTYPNQTTLAGLAPGPWTITENAVNGWDLTGISCTSNGIAVDLASRKVTVDLQAGDNVTCTFTNTKQPPPSTASLTIVKDAIPNDAQNFAFYASGPNSGSIYPFQLDDDAGAVGEDTLLSNSKTFPNLAPGSYTVSENFYNPVVVTGWDVTGVVCTSAGGLPVGTVDLGIFTVDLAAGDNVTCTFTNTKQLTSPDLSLTKTSVVSAQGITYTVTVTNNGSVATVDPIVVTDTVSAAPANSVFNFNGFGTACATSGSNTAICTSAAPLGAGQQVTFTFGYFVPTNGAGSWSGTVTNCATVPADSDLSNNQSCVTDTVGTAPTTASLTIIKDAIPNDAQDFAFYASGPNSGSIYPFQLDDDAGAVGEDTLLPNSKTFSNLVPGSYTISENFDNPVVVTGWDVASIICTSSTGITVGTVDLPFHGITLDLAAGDNVTCTFTNTPQPTPDTASLTIVKDAIPNDVQNFAFYASGPNSGSIYPFLLDDDAGAVDEDTLLSNSKTFPNLAPGSYTVSENFYNPVVVTGWDVTGVVCTSAGGLPVGTVDLGIFTVDLAAGDNVTCTFTNTKQLTSPDLSLTKTSVVSAQGITYTVTVTNNGSVATVDPIVVTDTVSAAPANSVFNFNGFGTACAVAGFNTAICTSNSPLGPGQQVTFTFGYFVPTNGNGSWSGTVTNCATVPVDSDLSNNQACVTDTVGTAPTTASLTIVKDAIPNDAQDFAFYASGPNSGSIYPFQLDDDAGAVGEDTLLPNSKTFSNLVPGSYTISENFDNPVVVTGWDVASIICTSSTGITVGTVDLPFHGITLDLAAGDNVTCTFTDTPQPPPGTASLTIVKDAIPNDAQNFAFYASGPNSGSIYPFLLDDDAGAVGEDTLLSNSKTFPNLTPGSYTVSENFYNPVVVTGWDVTGVVCTSAGGLPVGTVDLGIFTVDLAAGDNVTCTFTNTKQVTSPDLSLTKTSVVSAQGITYTVTVTNNGSVATVDPIVVTDTVSAAPANSVFNFNGFGTACATSGSNTAICTSAAPLGAGQQVTFTFGYFVPTNGAGSWSGTVTNCATVPADSDLSNNQSCVTDTVGNVPQTGTITIIKDAVPDDSQDFFFLFGNSGGSFVLDDDGSNTNTYMNHTTLASLAPGPWTFTEMAVNDWDLTSISCTSTGVTVDLANRNVTVNLAAGENVTCRFTNTKQTPSLPFTAMNAPTLQVSKSAGIPTVLMTQTSFSSTTIGSITSANVTAGPMGQLYDGIFSLVSPYWETLVGAVATLPSSILLLSGTTLSMTSASWGGSVGLSSADFGKWSIVNAFAPANSLITYITFAGGSQLASTMPLSGTATYVGKMVGVLANSPVGGSDDVGGNVVLNIDFDAGTISGSISGITNNIGLSTIAPCVYPVSAAACIYDSYAPSMGLSVPFSDITVSGGTISGNNFTATVTTPSITGASTMNLTGNFYGANADEIAGTFTISVPSPGPGMVLIGSFGAKQ